MGMYLLSYSVGKGILESFFDWHLWTRTPFV